jgi:hypothetical protein
MGENVEMGDFGQKWANVGKRSTTGTLPHVRAETSENRIKMGKNVKGVTSGKNGQASKNDPQKVCYPVLLHKPLKTA